MHAANRRALALSAVIRDIRAAGFNSYRAMARELNRRQVPTFRHGKRWYPTTVSRVLIRLATHEPAVEPGIAVLLRLRSGDHTGNARAVNGIIAAHRQGAKAAKFCVDMDDPSAPSLLGEAGLAIMRDEPGAFDLFPRVQFALLFGSARWLLASYATMLAEAGDGSIGGRGAEANMQLAHRTALADEAGTPLTAGQVTGDNARLAAEDRLRQGAKGPDDPARCRRDPGRGVERRATAYPGFRQRRRARRDCGP
ncbi:MAG: hypothetical protein QOH92_1546 [Chloroflexota bacterium]|jgi:hypothetical protein|nr:hypothetical protein [Chloroflexota bacterium]